MTATMNQPFKLLLVSPALWLLASLLFTVQGCGDGSAFQARVTLKTQKETVTIGTARVDPAKKVVFSPEITFSGLGEGRMVSCFITVYQDRNKNGQSDPEEPTVQWSHEWTSGSEETVSLSSEKKKLEDGVKPAMAGFRYEVEVTFTSGDTSYFSGVVEVFESKESGGKNSR